MTAYDLRKAERTWRAAWERAVRKNPALPPPDRQRYFVHDAAPFPNAGLHMGHVRTYVLGDVTARYQRALGKEVLYCTSFDAFGLPIELQASEQGISPRDLVTRSIRKMKEQLRALGISYDWSLVPCTCDPEYYRWTQWLFLQMFAAGLVERRHAPQPWCPRCETTLAQLQIEDGGCWRCGATVERRELQQWFIRISHYAQELRETLEDLHGWSDQARAMMRGLMRDPDGAKGSHGAFDWLVSRQRSWGTPIPLVECERCGVVPVSHSDLPVRLPEELDWIGGSGALARSREFIETRCPACGRAAKRETDTLDCFFDDIWCFLQAFVLHGDPPGFTRANLERWFPVDRAQSGLDTFYSFHLYRFLGRFLVERGLLDDGELVRSFIGNNVVLNAGRKMSKHLGNAVSPDAILEEFGADTLRIAMLWAAGPQRTIEWTSELLLRAREFLNATCSLVAGCRTSGTERVGADLPRDPSRAASALRRASHRTVARVSTLIEEYRPNVALSELEQLRRGIERFAWNRIRSDRLANADRVVLMEVLEDLVRALVPFAPHAAEECWHLLGHDTLVCSARWPTEVEDGVDPVSAG